MNRLLVIVFIALSLSTFGQSTEKYNSVYATFFRAEELYQKQQYGSARKEFRTFINSFQQTNDPLYIKALYYEGMSALELFNNDAVDLLKRFIMNYPETVYKNMVHFRLGNYYYRAKDYKTALDYFAKFKATDLEADYRNEYFFKVGYSNFQEGNKELARTAFAEVKDGDSQYANPALYYFSHIAYEDKNYQTALDGFLKLEGDEGFGKVVPYYIIQIYYLQGKYEEVTRYAPKLENATIVNEKDISHLIGDAYYKTGKFDEAIPHLEKFDKLAETTRDEDYQLAYAYYKTRQHDKAVKMFDRVTKNNTDSLAQTAYYHMGESYIALKNNLNARSAFQKASEIDANPTLQEDALYQFAVLSYKVDINPYNESIRAFETYLNTYPNSKRKEDVYQYLVNVYTSTNNYAKALESLDRVANKDIALKKVYQLIAYNYGIELYQKGKYEEAVATLKLVGNYPINPQLSAKAVYWSADANFQLANYPTAVSGFKSYLNMPGATDAELKSDVYYNMGYSNLYKGDTVAAIENFRTYVQDKPANKRKLSDAYMRLADSYFMRRDNAAAVQNYDNALALNIANQDQALYYKGLTHGVMQQQQEKIKSLLNIVNNYSKSKYVQDALFEIAFTYKLIPDYASSIKYYEQLLKDYPTLSKEANIRVEMADVYFKQSNYKKAEEQYLYVLEKFGQDDICNAVGEGLQNVYAATKQVSKLEEYASKYPCLNINALTVENLVYNPAEQDYQAKKYEEAITKFEEYLKKYPQGYHAKKATYYLADAYYELDNEEKAVFYYEKILSEATSSYTELSAIRASRYYYNTKQYQKAIPHYERSEQVSSDPEVIFNAKVGLMRSSYQIKDYSPAAAYAKQVLASNLVKTEGKLEAQYVAGIANYHTKNYPEAITALTFVSKNTTKATASESKWTIAKIYFDQDKLQEADYTAKEVLKMKPTYDYWIAKSLILQTHILVKQDDLFQAEQTISSVVNHYAVKDDGIIEEAQGVYDELMQLKNKPKTAVAPTGTTVIEINE